MSQVPPRPRARPAEREEVANLQQLAQDAAAAFRDYVLSGNPARRQAFWDIYNRPFAGQTVHDNREFMDRLFQEMDRLRQNPQIRPILDAYSTDRQIIEPVVMTDFLDTVFNIRSALERGTPTDAAVSTLVRQVNDSRGRPARADTQIGRVRALMESQHLSVEDAARAELQRPAREEAIARYGQNLVDLLIARMPREQARTSVLALREFILTGDTARRDEFRTIFDANYSNPAFVTAFTEYFQDRISRTTDGSGLAEVAGAYGRRRQGNADPSEFARMVADLYRVATTGTAADVTAIRDREGSEVVDPLLNIVARGMAGRAVSLMTRVLQSGDLGARDQFMAIMNGNLATVVNGTVQMGSVERNDAFFSAFSTLYQQQIDGDPRLTTMSRSFQRNILPIVIRDIFIELTRTSPDMARLNSAYGQNMVRLVQQNMGTFSWIVRPDDALGREIERRAGFDDTTAVQLRGMRVTFPIGHGLSEVYLAILAERTGMGTIEGRDLIEPNFDNLSYLNGSAAAVQRAIEQRANGRPPDSIALAMISRYGRNAGATLSASYARMLPFRQNRQRLVTAYGADFVDLVSRNMNNLYWVIRPVDEISDQMTAHRDDTGVAAITRGSGYSIGTFAAALRDIYASSDRARLEQRYGRELVDAVQSNRSNLSWLSGDQGQVEAYIQEHRREIPAALRAFVYSYSPVQFVSAIASGRAAFSRGGYVLADARDALGEPFTARIAAAAATARVVSPDAAQVDRAPIISRARQITGDLDAIEARLRERILAPAAPLLRERIRRWRIANEQIVDLANSTQDPDVIRQLQQRQQDELLIPMLSEGDLRRSVEMAFSMIHLAETGGDINRGVLIPGATTQVGDQAGLSAMLAWYARLNPQKQGVVADIVSSVLRRADPNLYSFITNMNEPAYFRALSRTYRVVTGASAESSRRDLVMAYGGSDYGERFVSLVEALRPNLQVLGGANPTINSLRMEENELFASIVTRVYLAITNPREGENRDTMVRLFGETFVQAVEAQRGALGPLGTPGAGFDQFRALPQATRTALMTAYPGAYSRSIGALMRVFRRQDDTMFTALGHTYEILSHRPARGAPSAEVATFNRRVGELNVLYGEAFVSAVQGNMDNLGFLQSPSAGIDTMRGLPVDLLTTLNAAFEQGQGVGRGTFMQNFTQMATVLPQVYLQIRSAMGFSNPSVQIAPTLQQAITLYRQEFGSNNYLFNNYFNLDILNATLPALARRYNITLPPSFAGGISTPEQLVQFLSIPGGPGQQLIRAGREFYDTIEREYLTQRDSIDPQSQYRQTGEFSDAEVANLRNRISIFDALYMGIALERVSGSDSAFRRASATAVMNSLITLENRDPYLVGPFLLQVLPALLQVAQDERTFVTALEAFNGIVAQRYEAGMRDLAYSTALNRRYFLEVFARIGQRLPEITSTMDHNRLEDELRLQPEPRTDEAYLSPFLYRYRPGFWQQGQEPLPMYFGNLGQPLSLLPRPFMSPPGLYVPNSPSILSDADGLFGRMSDQLLPPAGRMFRQRVPARFRIGALGASTILRRLNELFGPMPVDYSDYWLNALGGAGGFYSHGGTTQGSTDTAGAAAAVAGRTPTGAAAGQARYTYQDTETRSPGAPGAPIPFTSQAQHQLDVGAQAGRIPYPMAGIIPLGFGGAEPTYHSESEINDELQRRVQNADTVARALTAARPTGTAAALLDCYRELNRPEPNRDRLVRQYGETFVSAVEQNMSALNFVEAPDRGVGLHRGRTQFHYERSGSQSGTITPVPPGAPAGTQEQRTIGSDVVSGERTRGLLETYSRIARESQTDMLLFVSGEHVPELTSPGSATPGDIQQSEDRLKTRLYFVTREGNIYQLAYGIDTRAQLLNYLYGGANTQQYLASVRMVGRDSLVSPALSGREIRERTAAGRTPVSGDAARGFDGAAVGFTLPRSGGDSFSALAFGELIRDMSNMTPVAAQQAVGTAVTQLLSHSRGRDVYAAFYRGQQTVDLDPRDQTHITNTRWSSGTGEIMWRRMRVDDYMQDQWELRVVGGYPMTVGAQWRHEIPRSRYRTVAYGLMGAYTTEDLLSTYRMVDSQADQMYSRLTNVLVSLYGWEEDTARDTGWLAAGSYMYSRLEDYTVRDPTSPTGYRTDPTHPAIADHFATAMFMYWAQRHGFLIGAQRVPGWTMMYNRIDQAMREIQLNPAAEAQILQRLSQQIQADLTNDIWRFALGYGYDGEQNRVYVIGSGQYSRTQAASGTPGTPMQPIETSYASLYGLMLFGRPTRFYADILARGYVYAPLVIDTTQSTGVQVTRDQSRPFGDLYTGVGFWPNLEVQRYERTATIQPAPDLPSAMRDIYSELGGGANRSRLVRIYGEDVVAAMEGMRDDVTWMLRSEAEVRQELERRRRAEDPVARQLHNLHDVGTAAALIDIYGELRKANPNIDRLRRSYGQEMVDWVRTHAADLEWVMLPPDTMRAQLTRRATSGTALARITEMRMPNPPAQDQLTGPEVKTLFERNMRDVLISATNAENAYSLAPDRYDILLAPHLASPEGSRARSGTYYILHTAVGDRPESRGSLMIGDSDDLNQWLRQGLEVGRGITRVEVRRSEGNYNFVFSGDRRLRALTGVRLVGGITLPLSAGSAQGFDYAHNWSAGLLLQILQDHRHDLIAGALYGVRQYGSERWDQATVTLSHRFQAAQTATTSDQIFSYIFFNRTTQSVVMASRDVFNNPAELQNVCTALGVQQCTSLPEFQRVTGGVGVTWAQADLVVGSRISFHFFFEGGAESGQPVVGTTLPQGRSTDARFVFRTGIGFDYTRQAIQNPLGTRYFINLAAQNGTWPILPGEITRPELLRPYTDQIGTVIPGWSVMLHGGVQW